MRLVLVDRGSDRICGDTAEFAVNSAEWAENASRNVNVEHMSLIAARLLDESEGRRCWVYEFNCFRPLEITWGYDVFSVHEDAADNLPDVFHERSKGAMAALLTHAQYVGYVNCAPPVVPMKARRSVERNPLANVPRSRTGVRRFGTH